MLDISMNHVALVESPRIPDAMVADSRDGMRWAMIADALQTFLTPPKKEKPMKMRDFALQFNKLAADKTCKDADPDAATELHRRLAERFDAKELEEIAALIAKLAGAEEGEGERADGDPREALKDHDDFEEDEAPETEKMFKSRSVGRSPELGKTAMDAFSRRYPNAARVTTGGLWACRPDHGAVRKPQSEAQRAAFDARFPNLKRVA